MVLRTETLEKVRIADMVADMVASMGQNYQDGKFTGNAYNRVFGMHALPVNLPS